MEDLPKFFKDRSKDISKAFSNEVLEISTIRSKNVASDTQEFSFKLKLLTEVNPNTILPQIKHLIGFFKIYLLQEKSFTANIKVPQESSELYNNHCKANKTVEEFISNAPIQILLQGITITLQTNVKNINLNSLQQIEAFLNEQLKHVEKAKSEEQSQDTLQVEETENKNENVVEKGNTQGKQIVQDSFGYNIASNRKQITRAPVIVAAMHENFSWFRSFFHLPNFFNTTQFFSPQLPKFSIQKQKALTYHAALQNQKCAKNDQEISTTRLDTDCSAELSEESLVIKQAECDARVAMVDNELKNDNERKTLDEIFVKVVSEYKNLISSEYKNLISKDRNLLNTMLLSLASEVFKIVYTQDKEISEMLCSDKERLQLLERIGMLHSKSLVTEEYAKEKVREKINQLIASINLRTRTQSQPKNVSHEILPNKAADHLSEINEAKTPFSTNITPKSPLKTVFSSKETYFCLFLVAASISALCLWNLPMGKVSVLKELVPIEKRESIGLILNIGLPILITLCVLSLAYFIYSEYSVESIEQVSKKDLLCCT